MQIIFASHYRMRFLLILILSIPLYSQSSKVLCELNGEYSVTYKDIKKTYLAEGIELFRNLARQTQQSLFLLRRAKTNFAEEDWEKNSLYVVQYWDVDSAEETYKSLTHTLEPAPAWIKMAFIHLENILFNRIILRRKQRPSVT